ncbi:MAG: PLDc N-terminal domain-containing protein, partial [Flavobacteriaceae bacterium]|nr:PLDc N-terminal domain-containing protein [Flavobacteriaceae bacterium]
VSVGLLVYYIIHAVKNQKFDSNQRLMWILILVLAGMIGNIIYYFVEILPSKPKTNNMG